MYFEKPDCVEFASRGLLRRRLFAGGFHIPRKGSPPARRRRHGNQEIDARNRLGKRFERLGVAIRLRLNSLWYDLIDNA
jgi:hypothetical protein